MLWEICLNTCRPLERTASTFWHQQLHPILPLVPLPSISSSSADHLPGNWPSHDVTDLHGYVDSNWDICLCTQQSMMGVCLHLAEGTIAYKTKLKPIFAQSSIEAEFMGASYFGKILLNVHSVLWDLGEPQHAASVVHKGNDAFTAMEMAQKQLCKHDIWTPNIMSFANEWNGTSYTPSSLTHLSILWTYSQNISHQCYSITILTTSLVISHLIMHQTHPVFPCSK